jgi:hypothetical protein
MLCVNAAVLQEQAFATPAALELSMLLEILSNVAIALRRNQGCAVAFVADERLAGSLSTAIEKLLPQTRRRRRIDEGALVSLSWLAGGCPLPLPKIVGHCC